MCTLEDASQNAVKPLPDTHFSVRASARFPGVGLFARETIEENQFLFDYQGDVFLEHSPEGQIALATSEYVVGVINTAGIAFVVDASNVESSNLARYLNHAPAASPVCNAVLVEQSAMAANAAYAATLKSALEASECASAMKQFTVADAVAQQQALVTKLLEAPEKIPPPRLHMYSSKAIAAGDELLWDYGDAYWEGMAKRGQECILT